MEEWKASNCCCPTVAGRKEVRYDLFRHTTTPYTGEVVVAVSSYVGYYRVDVEADITGTSNVNSPQSGRPWSTQTDSTQQYAEVKDFRYWVADGVLYGQATFLA